MKKIVCLFFLDRNRVYVENWGSMPAPRGGGAAGSQVSTAESG